MRLASVGLWLLLTGAAWGQQTQYAVVRISSHGGSGTVIETGPGRSLILTAAHLFNGRDRDKRLKIDLPSPQPGPTKYVTSRVLKIDQAADLALVELQDGPLPYCCPVAANSPGGALCLSVGYDNQKLPATTAPTHIVSQQGSSTFTRESPWHGRSGGALIDQGSGRLVGVVSGYMGSPRNRQGGAYASHSAIVSFLGGGPQPQQQQRAPLQQQPYQAPRFSRSALRHLTEAHGGAVCPGYCDGRMAGAECPIWRYG